MREGGGGWWDLEAPFKNRMTPPSAYQFFLDAAPPPPLTAVIFSDDPVRKKKKKERKKPSLKISTFLIFSIIVLTMKTIFTIPMLQRAVY